LLDVAFCPQAQQSDTVVAVTTDRKLVVWKFNPCAAFRTLEGHRDWVEDMILVRRREDPAQEDSLTTQVYSAGADGILLRWAATTSANGDLYSVEEELEGHEGSVLCCTYSEDLDVLISGSDDLTIRIWDLGTPAMRLLEGKDGEEKENSNVLEGHEARITGLACCSDQVRFASSSPTRV
jgi:WD40 repeat protein